MARISYFVLAIVTMVVLIMAYSIHFNTFRNAKYRNEAYTVLTNINKSYHKLQYALLRCITYADVSKNELEEKVANLRHSLENLEKMKINAIDTHSVKDELQLILSKVENLTCTNQASLHKSPQDYSHLSEVFESNLVAKLETIRLNYEMKLSSQRQQVFLFIKLLILLFLVFIALVTYFVSYTNREKNKLIRLQESLKKSLITDTLTQLKNRNAITKDFDKSKENLTVVIFNIVKFKHINDFYGTSAGDYVLQSVAMRLQKIIQKYKISDLYRVGGDDFVVVCKKGNINTILDITKEVMQYYQNHGIKYIDTMIDISIVAGITQTKPYLETADLALKAAKKDKNSAIVIYTNELDNSKTIKKNFEALKMLKDGIINDRFFPQFQPIVELQSGKISKYEALIRLKKEDGTIICPESFIEEAKESKLLGKLTKIMLIKSFETFKHVDCSFSVNLSFSEIIDEKNQDQIIEILDNYGRHAKKLTFEILEDEAIENYCMLNRFLSKVEKFGVDIAIDDFGSGYSNFEHIIGLNTHFLKIDGSLIKIIDHNLQARVLVQSIVDFAKSMKIKTIAEFVHSKEVLDIVKRLGIDYAQGFYVGKPVSNLINSGC